METPQHQNQPVDPQLEAFAQQEIARATQPLHDRIERGGAGAQANDVMRQRIGEISQLVVDSPDRVAADLQKSPDRRTEYDAERAHLAALAIDKNMTRLASDKQRNAAGKGMLPWRKTASEQDLLGSKLGERLANEVYDNDPTEAGPHIVESQRLQTVEAGNKAYKHIKGAKLPRV